MFTGKKESKVQVGLRNTGIYRGFFPAMIGSFPGQFTHYIVYEYAHEKLTKLFPRAKESNSIFDGMMTRALSGLVAETACGLAYLPTDIISQRLQVTRSIDFRHIKFRQKNSWGIIKNIWKTEGFHGYFRGYYAYLMVYGPNSAIWWASYEAFKKLFHASFSFSENVTGIQIPWRTSLNHLLSGAVAGICSVVVTNPLDVARTRIQLLEAGNKKEYTELKQGFYRMLKNIVKEEGVQGLYKGLKPRIFVRIPGSAILFVGYEWLKENSAIEGSANKI